MSIASPRSTQPPDMDVESNPKSNWIRGENALLERMEKFPEWLEQLLLLAQDCLEKNKAIQGAPQLTTSAVREERFRL